MVTESRSVAQTRRLGATLAQKCRGGDVYGLVGALGTGKTEFVRGFVASLQADAGVRSPTFTLVNTYLTASFPIHHFDFYRLSRADDLREIGFYEYAGVDGVCLVEWADMFPDVLPQGTRMIRFEDGGGDVRRISYEQ